MDGSPVAAPLVEVIDLHSPACVRMLADYIAANPQVWNEDIGED